MSSRISATLLTPLLLVQLTVSSAAAEVPMWEGIEKTEKQLAADQKFIDQIRQATNGDLEEGAVDAIKRGWQSIGKGDAESAIRRFNQAWLLAPERGDIYWGYAIATGMRGDPDEAVDHYFEKAHAIIGEESRLYSDWGRIHLQRNNDDRAEKYFERAIVLDPKNPEPHVGMALIAKKRGDTSSFRKHVEAYEKLQ